eukprot:GHVR01013801.1.p1 GENE.GHVR01013801.1~~GHVR01013801.1.p1  ORF type:complete len:233 (+),score=120.01 GHVR01013801.1:100-798(+)
MIDIRLLNELRVFWDDLLDSEKLKVLFAIIHIDGSKRHDVRPLVRDIVKGCESCTHPFIRQTSRLMRKFVSHSFLDLTGVDSFFAARSRADTHRYMLSLAFRPQDDATTAAVSSQVYPYICCLAEHILGMCVSGKSTILFPKPRRKHTRTHTHTHTETERERESDNNKRHTHAHILDEKSKEPYSVNGTHTHTHTHSHTHTRAFKYANTFKPLHTLSPSLTDTHTHTHTHTQ